MEPEAFALLQIDDAFGPAFDGPPRWKASFVPIPCLCALCCCGVPAVVFLRAVLSSTILSSPACKIFLHASMLASIGACVRVRCEAFHIPPLRKGTSVLSGFLLSCVGKHRSTLYLAPPKPSMSKSRSVSFFNPPPTHSLAHSLTHSGVPNQHWGFRNKHRDPDRNPERGAIL